MRTLLPEGSPVPRFEVLDTHGNLVCSEDLVGKKSFILWFYPKDDTPG